nr:PilC/PilY family type IV pilus protein [uncultured Noviherbaspirillum sp.]
MRRFLPAMLLAAAHGAPAMPVLKLASAAELARAGACVAVVTDSTGNMLYQATAGAAGLEGELAAYPLQRDAAGRPVIAAQPLWNAASLLDARDPGTRQLFTAQQDGTRLRTIALEWQALDAAQRALLADDGMGVAAHQRLAYLRGERAMEASRPGGRLRPRRSLLGATVAGAPLFVPPATAVDDTRLAAFMSAASRRPATIYLQANDGMLHAFDAATGAELFAYLPQALQPYWPRLSTSAHAASPYADGGIAAAGAQVFGTRKTVLVGGLGSAAQGLFGLDISDPSRFGQGGGVLFEFTDRDDPDIGNIFNAPAIARFRTGAATQGDFVVAASGYNNNRADGEGRSSTAGPGVLFLLSLDRDVGEPWQLDRNYFKFMLPAASDAVPNGLAQPALVPFADGSVQSAFAGDLQGQVWRLDLGAGAPWAGQAATPMFAARDALGKRQPVTTPLRVVHAGQGMLLLFGTGRLLEAADADDKSMQSFYAVSDQIKTPPTASRAMLARRAPVADGNSAGAYRLERQASSPSGWVLDFPLPGERIVASPALVDGRLYFATLRPGAAACAPAGGLYQLDALAGEPPASATAPWLGLQVIPGRTLAVVPGRGPASPGGASGPGAPASDALLGAGAGKPVPLILKKSRSGRLGWREVRDWEARPNANLPK